MHSSIGGLVERLDNARYMTPSNLNAYGNWWVGLTQSMVYIPADFVLITHWIKTIYPSQLYFIMVSPWCAPITQTCLTQQPKRLYAVEHTPFCFDKSVSETGAA